MSELSCALCMYQGNIRKTLIHWWSVVLNIVFWVAVAFDVTIVLLISLLGLAAAKPSHTHPLAALLVTFIVPGVILAGLIVLFLRAPSRGWRIGALVLTALPLLVTLVGQGVTHVAMLFYQDEAGNIRQFRTGPLREIEIAIERNNVAAVTSLAQGADVNQFSLSGVTVLGIALRQLEKTPEHGLEVVRALLKAGVDPNASKAELPLQTAIGLSRSIGPELVNLLLTTDANPNARGEFGDPVFFIAGGKDIQVEIMQMLLAHGADVQLRDRTGNSAVYLPVITGNWKVLRLLLQQGAPWQDVRAPGGMPFRAYVEGEARLGADADLSEVIKFLQTAEANNT